MQLGYTLLSSSAVNCVMCEILVFCTYDMYVCMYVCMYVLLLLLLVSKLNHLYSALLLINTKICTGKILKSAEMTCREPVLQQINYKFKHKYVLIIDRSFFSKQN